MDYLKNTVATQKDPTNLKLTELLEEQKKLDHNIGEWKKTRCVCKDKSAAVTADRARGPMGNQVLADLEDTTWLRQARSANTKVLR